MNCVICGRDGNLRQAALCSKHDNQEVGKDWLDNFSKNVIEKSVRVNSDKFMARFKTGNTGKLH